MPETLVTEAIEAAGTATSTGGGVFLIDLITPGWGSSGYYSADVLEQAAGDKVFPAGTHMYIDHQTAQERQDKPEGSLRDLAAVLMEDAVWTGESLQAKARVFSPWRQSLDEMKEAIGTSIRAAADVEFGEAEGRKGRLIGRLVHAESVDFVTHAGRGGRIVEVLEAATVSEARTIGQWIESRIHRDFTVTADDMAGEGRLTREERITLSGAIGDALAAFVGRLEADAPALYQRDLWDDPADTVAAATESTRRQLAAVAGRAVESGVEESTVNDRREALEALLRDEYAADRVYVWLKDFDETTAWFTIEGGDDAGMWQQAYTTGDNDLPNALTGERTEVRAVTTYVPAIPAGQSTTQESEEDNMATTEIEETRLRQLEEDAGRVTALESERDAEKARAEAAEAKVDDFEAKEAAAARGKRLDEIVAEADVEFTALETGGLKVQAVDKDGALDEAAFKKTVTEAAAAKQAANGAGRVRGNGQRTHSADNVSEADLNDLDDAVFGTIKEA